MYFTFGKKGDAEEVSWPQVIFLVLVIAFMAVFFIFAKDSLTGSLIQEEVYAKKIALMINSAQPGTDLLIDITSLKKIAIKNGVSEDLQNRTITLNNNAVLVSTRSGGKAYVYSYYSDYNISGKMNPIGEKLFYLIKVEGRKNG
jgi:hypothetical protein